MAAQEFFAGVSRYAVFALAVAVIAVVAGLLPLAVGWLLGQRSTGVYGFAITVIAFLFLGWLIGLMVLVVCTSVVAVVSLKRRRKIVQPNAPGAS